MNASDYTIEISCKCAVCKENAEFIGQPFPLAAKIRPLTAQGLGITERNAHTKKAAHRLVYIAHEPFQQRHHAIHGTAPIAIPA